LALALYSEVIDLGNTVVTESSSVDKFVNHFTAKVNGIHTATVTAPVADVEHRATSSLNAFQAETT